MIISQICADIVRDQRKLQDLHLMQMTCQCGAAEIGLPGLAQLAAAVSGRQQMIRVHQSLLACAGAANDCAMAPEVA